MEAQVETKERDCPMCKGEGALDYSRYDPNTGMWSSGRVVCTFCGGAGVVKVPIKTMRAA